MLLVTGEHDEGGARGASVRGRCLFALIAFLIGIVPVTQIAKAVAPASVSCPGQTYSVVKGDSWSLIASRSKVKMPDLLNANHATTATIIHPGQTLCLPVAAPVTPPTTATTTTTTSTTLPVARPATPPPSATIDAFPVQGLCSFTDTFGAARSGGRGHEGVDIIAKAGQWLYAAKDGTLTKKYVDAPGSLSGNGWRLTTGDGTYFFYAHMSAFAPGLVVGSAVTAGQIIGQVGMTGNAPIPHLHFEVHPGGGAAVNPTPIVKAVDGCKVTAVPPQPGGVVPATTVPATTVPAPTGPASTVPAPTTPVTTAPPTTVPVPTTTPAASRRDPPPDPGAPISRPRR